jgi:hypothetical protein
MFKQRPFYTATSVDDRHVPKHVAFYKNIYIFIIKIVVLTPLLRRPMRTADNLTTFMCRLSLKSGNLNLLEPSRPVQDCNGIALPLPFYFLFIALLQWDTDAKGGFNYITFIIIE